MIGSAAFLLVASVAVVLFFRERKSFEIRARFVQQSRGTPPGVGLFSARLGPCIATYEGGGAGVANHVLSIFFG